MMIRKRIAATENGLLARRIEAVRSIHDLPGSARGPREMQQGGAMFKFLKGKRSEQAQVRKTLEYLSLSRAAVRVEIENSLERFMSQLTMEGDSILITRPPRPTLDLASGSHIRVRLPGADRRELRLQVVKSRVVIGLDEVAFVCKPARHQFPTRRVNDRYSVRRYKNLRIDVEGERFRIVDISVSGCRLILSSPAGRRLFPLGETIHSAHLAVGSRISIRLLQLTPRIRSGHLVGCEFVTAPDGLSDKYLQRLISSLEKKEQGLRAS